MKKISAAITLLLFVTGNLMAQNYFTKTFSNLTWGSISYDAHVTSDGGFVAAGIGDFLFKADSTGNVEWAKGFISTFFPGLQSFYCLPSNEGGYMQAGVGWTSGGQGKVYTIKTTASGSSSLLKYFPLNVTNQPMAFIQSPVDNSYYLLGSGCAGLFVIKLNTSGNKIWAKTYGIGPSGSCAGFDMIETSDGNFLICGPIKVTTAESDELDILVLKINSLGNVIWCKVYDASHHERAENIVELPEGGYFISGFTTDSIQEWFGNAFFTKIDTAGNPLWGGVSDIETMYRGSKLLADSTGVVAVIQSNTQTTNRIILKFDNGNNIIWAKSNITSGQFSTNGMVYRNAEAVIISSDQNSGQTVYEKLDSSFTQFCTGVNQYNPVINNSFPTVVNYSVWVMPMNTVETLANISAFPVNYSTGNCGPTEVDEKDGNLSSLNIFPNPAINDLRIESPEFNIESIDVNDLMGKQIIHLNLNGENKTVIDVHALPAGIYFVTVRDEKNNRVMKKIVKM